MPFEPANGILEENKKAVLKLSEGARGERGPNGIFVAGDVRGVFENWNSRCVVEIAQFHRFKSGPSGKSGSERAVASKVERA
jgi:hypothetical protein